MKKLICMGFVVAVSLLAVGPSVAGSPGAGAMDRDALIEAEVMPADEAMRPADGSVRVADEMRMEDRLRTFPAAYDYLIVVPDRLLESVAPLAEWKMKKGLKTSVISLSSIGEDPGYDEISSYIHRLHEISTTPIRYILLAGDVEDIPPHYRERDYGDSTPSDDEWVVSDMFYGIVGAGPFADIHVGRFPASTAEEMEAIVQKTLEYEKEPPRESGDWFSNALLFGSGEADAYAAPGAWCEYGLTTPIPSDSAVLESFGWDVTYRGPDSDARISEIINRGMSLVCSYGHGTPRRVEGFSREAVPLLENGSMLPLWISGCCNSARFDNETRTHETVSGNSLAEVLIRPRDKGVVGFIGCSRTGGPGYHYMFFDGCFEELMRSGRMGPVMDAGKRTAHRAMEEADAAGLCHEDSCSARKRQYLIEHYNLLGDPELPLYTKTPRSFHVSVNGSPEPLRTDGRIGVEGAVVCLRRAGNEMLVGETDGDGEAAFDPPASWTRFDVTVTKKNFVPSSETYLRGDAADGALERSIPGGPVTVKVEDADATLRPVMTRMMRDKKLLRVDPEVEARIEFIGKDVKSKVGKKDVIEDKDVEEADHETGAAGQETAEAEVEMNPSATGVGKKR